MVRGSGWNRGRPATTRRHRWRGSNRRSRGVERRIDELIAALEGTPPTLPPVDTTPTSGERFRRFLSLADDLLVRAAQDVRATNPQDVYTSGILDRFSDFAQVGRGEVAQLIELSRSIPLETQAQLDAAVVDGAPELLHEITSSQGKTSKLQVEMDGGGNEVVSTILSKAGTALSSVPILGGLLNAILDDAAKLFEGNSELAQLMSGMALAELELELKLDAIVRGLFGVSIDEAMDETALREQLRQVTQGDIPQRFAGLDATLDELRQKLDNLGWWLGRLTTGMPIGIEPHLTNVLPETNLWSLLDALEAKLDRIIGMLDDLQASLDELHAALNEQHAFLEARFTALDQTLGNLRADLLSALGAVQAAVATNGRAIAAVQAAVNANADTLTAIQNQLDGLDQVLDDLHDWLSDEFDAVYDTQQDILDDLFDLSLDVADNADAIADNGTAIAANADAIADNGTAIAANADAIASVQAGVNAEQRGHRHRHEHSHGHAVAGERQRRRHRGTDGPDSDPQGDLKPDRGQAEPAPAASCSTGPIEGRAARRQRDRRSGRSGPGKSRHGLLADRGDVDNQRGTGRVVLRPGSVGGRGARGRRVDADRRAGQRERPDQHRPGAVERNTAERQAPASLARDAGGSGAAGVQPHAPAGRWTAIVQTSSPCSTLVMSPTVTGRPRTSSQIPL